jgi:SAM-dependent methyltransferase
MKDTLIRRIVASYDDPIVRAYSTVRFIILRERFLEEIGQYLPAEGNVVDIGCGFGLFALYFAARNPRLRIFGIDRNARRIEWAKESAQKLGIGNVHFDAADARDFSWNDELRAGYMLDLIHHIAPSAVRTLIRQLVDRLAAGGRLIIKDVGVTPFYKLAFTWLLDKLMDPRAAVNYWSQQQVIELLRGFGMTVYRHAMIDILPYPHMIYIAQKEGFEAGTIAG